MMSDRTERQTARGAATRRLLLDATRDCLVRRGYAGTSTAAICAEAGMTAGALFGQFPSKRALLAAVAVDLVAQAEVLIEQACTPAQASPGPTLGPLFDQLVEVWQTPVLTALAEMWAAARTDRAMAAVLVKRRALHDTVATVLARRFAPGRADVDITALAVALLHLVSGSATSEQVHRGARVDPPDEQIAALLALVERIGWAPEP